MFKVIGEFHSDVDLYDPDYIGLTSNCFQICRHISSGHMNTTYLKDCLRFLWRGLRFQVFLDLKVKEVKGQYLYDSPSSILLEALLKKEMGSSAV